MMRRELPSDPLLWLRESVEGTPPDGAEARLAARLAALSAPAALGAAATASLAPSAAPPSPVALPVSSPFKILAERFVRWSLVPFGLGAGLGAATMHSVRSGEQPRPAAVAQVPAAIPSASSAAIAELGSEPTPEPAIEPTPAAAPAVSAAKSTLPIERDLLDRARRQLASDEPARALTFLEQHAQRFPRGQLSEEREAMWVNVLALLGRKDDAKARGEQFEARFPHSLMGSSVKAAVKAAGDGK